MQNASHNLRAPKHRTKKVHKKTKIGVMFRSSFIIYHLTRFSAFVYQAILSSVFGFIMTSYDRVCAAFSTSLIVTKLKALSGSRGGRTMAQAKHAAAKAYENSFLLSHLRGLSRRLLLTHVNTAGLFFFSFGFYIVVIQLLKQYMFNVANLNPHSLIAGVSVMSLSIFMFFSKKNVAAAI